MDKNEQLRKDLEFDMYWNLCLILEEITGTSHRDIIKKYKSVGSRGTIGVIIAEIRRRKYEGDKLRVKMEAYKAELSHLRQLDLFKDL